MAIREKDIAALTRLWRELDEFPASEGEASLVHALEELKTLLGAERSWWLVAKRKHAPPSPPGERWRDWASVHQAHANGSAEDQAAIELMVQRYKAGEANLFHRRRFEIEAPSHVTCPRDVMTSREWYRDWYFDEVRRPRGLDDIVIGAYAFDERTTVHIGLDRALRDRRFDRRSRDVLRLFAGGARAWLREQLLHGGWIEARSKLSPRERDVLSLLLTDRSEKQIAGSLGLTERSAHQYVTAVYRAFRVSGRAGLAALWLRHRGRG